MQFFELLLVLIPSVYLLINRKINNKISSKYLTGIFLITLFLQLLFEGYRWQMIPAYLIWAVALLYVIKKPENTSSRIKKVFRGIAFVIILFSAILLPSIFPVFELPETTGPYTVGTRDIFLELDRKEIITKDEFDTRKLMIKAWYPSDETGDEMDAYVDPAGRHGFAKKYGLPSGTFNYLDKVKTNVYRDIKFAEGKFPVLIFSHGYNSKANSYYALLSEIVSQGYIVFAINHTYESTGSTFPDGTEVYFDYEYAQSIESDTWHLMQPVREAFKKDLSFEERHAIVRKGLISYFVKDIVERWAADITDVTNMLENWNTSGFFKGKLDVSRLGIFGHSRGGGAAGEALLTNSRFKAGVNIDGVQWGKIVDTSFQQPFLFISADWPEDHEDLNQHAYVNKSTSQFYQARIENSQHSNFMDVPYMIPFKELSQAGDIDPDTAIEITTKLVISFFDKKLKNKDIDLSNLDLEYELLELETFYGETSDTGYGK